MPGAAGAFDFNLFSLGTLLLLLRLINQQNKLHKKGSLPEWSNEPTRNRHQQQIYRCRNTGTTSAIKSGNVVSGEKKKTGRVGFIRSLPDITL
jgi:hypothetical protein